MGRDARKASRRTILYIDDDRLLLTLCSNVLEQHGYRALIAPDGPLGIETAQQVRPDVILLDLAMPGMDGLEVCRRVRRIPTLRDTPIILFTAHQDLKLDGLALAAGATLTLRKTYDTVELVNSIRRLLEQGRRSPTETA